MRCLKAFSLLCVMLFVLAACESRLDTAALGYPDMDSEDFAVYSKHCKECHAPPLPSAHIAAEWPNVIERMQQHRVERSMGPIPADQVAILRAYVVKHAKAE